jgi:hypothetical protein
MIIVTMDDHRRDLSRVFAVGVFRRVMVIVFGDLTSLRASDREGWFSRTRPFTDTAAV